MFSRSAGAFVGNAVTTGNVNHDQCSLN